MQFHIRSNRIFNSLTEKGNDKYTGIKNMETPKEVRALRGYFGPL